MGLRDFASRLFGAKGTVAPADRGNVKNELLLSEGAAGSELYSLLTGAGSGSGVAVTEGTAMMTSAVYASVGLIGGAVASLPFHLYKRSTAGRERYDSDLWWLFNESPHPAWTSASAWQHAMQSILLKGDAFWTIERASRLSPRAIGFRPSHPDDVFVESDDDGRLVYTIFEDGRRRVYEQDDMLHFTGLGFDGERSLTPIKYALLNAAGTSLAADRYSGTFFRGGARPDYAIEVPAEVRITAEQREMLKATWSAQRTAYYTSGSTPVLTAGMKIVPLTLNAEDAQLLETRQFGVEEIARIFGVPPHMIGKTDASTSWGSGIEQMSIGFVRYTLRRHLDAIQQEINRKLWPRSKQFFGEFSTAALLEGDSKAQAEYFAKALGGPGSQGWVTPNEVRRLLNMPPVDGGDKLIISGATANESVPATAGTQ